MKNVNIAVEVVKGQFKKVFWNFPAHNWNTCSCNWFCCFCCFWFVGFLFCFVFCSHSLSHYLGFKNTMYFTLLQQPNPLSRSVSVFASTPATLILSTWSIVWSILCVWHISKVPKIKPLLGQAATELHAASLAPGRLRNSLAVIQTPPKLETCEILLEPNSLSGLVSLSFHLTRGSCVMFNQLQSVGGGKMVSGSGCCMFHTRGVLLFTAAQACSHPWSEVLQVRGLLKICSCHYMNRCEIWN